MSKPAAPKPWRREHPGRYVSADARFAIEGDAGRWFVLDEAEHDELGQPRTVGPAATLDDAKAEAERLREAAPPASPLEARIEAGRKRPRTEAAKPAAQRAASREDRVGRENAGAAAAAPPAPPERPAPPPEPIWLARLGREDAARARRWIAELSRLGLPDPERLVRAEFEANVPSVARALLARRIRETALAGLDPALAATVRHAVAAALEQVSGLERDPGAPKDLPGWRLVEHDPSRQGEVRRIRLGEDELT